MVDNPNRYARGELPGDAEEIRRVVCAAFPSVEEADLVDSLRAAAEMRYSLVGIVDSRIVAHVAFSEVTIGEAEPTTRMAPLALAPLAVEPGYQRQGVGATLVETGVEMIRENTDCPFVVVLGSPGYYSRFGFEPASVFDLRCEFTDGPAFQVLKLAEGILPTGLVRYCSSFAALS